ncbi:MAG: LAGLIDADG family homing endonuclease [Candidatus Aenigmatarchaeota archaeon]
MKFNQSLATIHAYLCADGYVITNPPTQKHKYYYIGLRNTNEIILQDFQKNFERAFGIKPIITKEKDRCKIQNKNLFLKLTKNFSFYSDKWTMPKLSLKGLRCWLRAFFDCEAWVNVQKGKSRVIGLESVNKNGLEQIRNSLLKFGIKVSNVKKRKNRNIWYIYICGKENLLKFKENIGFLHPNKNKKLLEAINSYINYEWLIPSEREEFIKFVNDKGKLRNDTKEVRFFSIIKDNLIRLKEELIKYGIDARMYGPWKNNRGRIYYCLSFKQKELIKLRR